MRARTKRIQTILNENIDSICDIELNVKEQVKVMHFKDGTSFIREMEMDGLLDFAKVDTPLKYDYRFTNSEYFYKKEWLEFEEEKPEEKKPAEMSLMDLCIEIRDRADQLIVASEKENIDV